MLQKITWVSDCPYHMISTLKKSFDEPRGEKAWGPSYTHFALGWAHHSLELEVVKLDLLQIQLLI